MIHHPAYRWAQATDEIGGQHYPRVKVVLGGSGVDDGNLSAANPLPVEVVSMPQSGGGLTDAELRAEPIDVAITGTIPVSGSFWQATQPVSIAAAVPVTGTFWQATQPVSLATLPKAREDSVAMTWASAKNVAPAQSAVQADTGQLAAGDYDFDIFLACSDTVAVGKGLVVEHRNAANNATTHNLGACTPNGGSVQIQIRRYTIALNERIRVIAGTAAGAASSMYVSAIGRRIA